MSELCDNCDKEPANPALPVHPCLYSEEMGGERVCNCCEDCMYQCMRDI